MRALAHKADVAMEALQQGDKGLFARCISENFALRLSLYGEEKVGRRNREAIDELKESSYAGKFPGSGGAIIAAPFDPNEKRPPPEIAGYVKVIPVFYTPNEL